VSWAVAIVTGLMWLAIGAGVLLWCAWDVFARMLDWLDDEEDD
jgi:hypothetical protein